MVLMVMLMILLVKGVLQGYERGAFEAALISRL